jgi:hypothetical protein
MHSQKRFFVSDQPLSKEQTVALVFVCLAFFSAFTHDALTARRCCCIPDDVFRVPLPRGKYVWVEPEPMELLCRFYWF